MIVATSQGDREARTLESPFSSLSGEEIVRFLGLDQGNYTGRIVTPGSALQGTPALYACVRLIAEVSGSLPCHLFMKTPEGRRRILPGMGMQGMAGPGYPGNLARVVGEVPNPEMSAQLLWETAVGHGALWGCAYIEVVRDAAGRVAELWPLRPDKMQVMRVQTSEDSARLGIAMGEKFYCYSLPTGRIVKLTSDQVMPLPWFGTDGMTGISPVEVLRNTIGSDQAAQEFLGRFYKNQAVPSAVMTVPRGGSQDKFTERSEMYRNAVQGLYGGMNNAGRVAVLEEGITWQQVQMPMADAQYVETRLLTMQECGAVLGVPPHLYGDHAKNSTWGSGIEQIWLGFLTTTLRPKLQRLENGANRALGLVPGVKTLMDEGLYIEFSTNELLRTDVKTRFDAYGVATANQFLTTNEIRAFENLPPVPWGEEPIALPGATLGPQPTPAVPMMDPANPMPDPGEGGA